MKKYKLLIILIPFLILCCNDKNEDEYSETKPNILLIVADDLGYSDIGPFGGEINTPTLDKLAENGIKLTNFHVLPTCSPTRSVLMSGTDNHIAGLGSMGEIVSPKQKGNPGYEGYLNDRVAHLPSILKDSGYRTYMSGKWHLGHEKEHRPFSRGFEESFSLLPGGGSHWNDKLPLSPPQLMIYSRNGEVVDELPKNFYSTKNYTDYILEWLERDKNEDKPFFAYLSYTAPHDPLHAPKEYIEKYKGKYSEGYQALREQRLKRLQELGILPEDVDMFPWGGTPNWNDLPEDKRAASERDMEVYAAMVDYMDGQIERVFKWLEENNEMENTMIIFFSDNGANGADKFAYPGQTEEFVNTFNNSLENRGLKKSYIEMGPGWATASMSPRRLFKAFTSEGGIISPCIIKLPLQSFNKGSMVNAFIHVSDIMPTFLDLAGVTHPGINDLNVPGMMGKSILSLLNGEIDELHPNEGIGYELHGLRAYIKGDWKILNLPIPFGTGDWELFNLREDPAESNDLSSQYPEIREELIKAYKEYEKKVGVIFDPIDMSIVEEKN
ncbi:MAG: arylsulfatase [Ignavibacteriaceae bacterium]